MKHFTIALLMSFCLAGLVSSRSHHSLRQRYYDSDEDPEFENARQCQAGFQTCLVPLLTKYSKFQRDPTATFLQIRQNGARAACSDALTFGGCIQQELEQETCQQGLPSSVKGSINKYLNFNQKLCVDRIDDFSKHWNCLLSFDVAMKMTKCESYVNAGPFDQCDKDQLTECIVGLYASNPDCQAGSSDFIRGFLPEVFIAADVCPTSGLSNFKRLLEKHLQI